MKNSRNSIGMFVGTLKLITNGMYMLTTSSIKNEVPSIKLRKPESGGIMIRS